ncbi:MAG TPA: hypothetical protein VF467_08490 [Afipia sp.]
MQLELQHVDPHADPHDVIVAQLRDLAPRLSEVNVTPSTPPQPAALPQPASEPPIHAAPSNDNAGEIHHPAPRRGLARSVAGLIVCAGIAAAAAWHSYGDEAKQRLSHLVPQLLAGAPSPTQNTGAAESQDATSQITVPQPATDPAPTHDTVAAASATISEPATAPATPTAETALTQAALSPELTQSIVTMAREVAALKQTVEQLQASQQQLSRDVAKVAEREARRKSAAQASKPTPPSQPQRTSTQAPVTRSVQPASAQAYPQGPAYPQTAAQREAYISPPAPMQLPPQPGDTSVPRPPMPLR